MSQFEENQEKIEKFISEFDRKLAEEEGDYEDDDPSPYSYYDSYD